MTLENGHPLGSHRSPVEEIVSGGWHQEAPSGVSAVDRQDGLDAKTPKRRRPRTRSTTEFLGFLRRILAAMARRGVELDPEDIPDVLAIQAALDQAITGVVINQRANGFSWSEIAGGFGITKQAAQQRWGRAVAAATETGDTP